MKNNTCKDCQKREIGCHSICKEYIGWKNEHERIAQEIRDIKDKTTDIESAKHAGIKRMKRGRKK